MNKLTFTRTTISTLVSAVALITLAGCNQDVAKPLTAEEKIVAPNDHVRGLLKNASTLNAQATADQNNDSSGGYEDDNGSMTTVIFDGSSELSFQASIEEFQSLANGTQASALNSAIDYLKFYDLSARGNIVKLYQTLDGLTAEQIILRAKGIRRD